MSVRNGDEPIGVQLGETRDGQAVVASHSRLDDTDYDRDRPKNRHAARGPKRTSFHANEADDEQKFNRLWEIHDGHDEWATGDSRRYSVRDKVETAVALCDTLQLSVKQKREVLWFVERADGRKFNRFGNIEGNAHDDDGTPTTALEAMALGFIAAVDNLEMGPDSDYEKRIQVREYDTHDGDLPLYKHLADQHDVDWRQAIGKAKEEILSRR